MAPRSAWLPQLVMLAALISVHMAAASVFVEQRGSEVVVGAEDLIVQRANSSAIEMGTLHSEVRTNKRGPLLSLSLSLSLSLPPSPHERGRE